MIIKPAAAIIEPAAVITEPAAVITEPAVVDQRPALSKVSLRWREIRAQRLRPGGPQCRAQGSRRRHRRGTRRLRLRSPVTAPALLRVDRSRERHEQE
jgi:hypothetical protein